MSEENVEIVRAQYASFGQITEGGEVHSWVLGYFDPNCEYRPVEEVDAIRGHEALIEWTERWLEAWSSYSDQVEEIIDGGEIVVAATTITGRGRTSGVEIRQHHACTARREREVERRRRLRACGHHAASLLLRRSKKARSATR